jgi:hypothetical protein
LESAAHKSAPLHRFADDLFFKSRLEIVGRKGRQTIANMLRKAVVSAIKLPYLEI